LGNRGFGDGSINSSLSAFELGIGCCRHNFADTVSGLLRDFFVAQLEGNAVFNRR